MAAVGLFLAFCAILVAVVVTDWYSQKPLWRVRYFYKHPRARERGHPIVPFDERPVSMAMDFRTARDYAAIFGGTVERIPK